MCEFEASYFFSKKQHIQLDKTINVSGVTDNVIQQLYDDRHVNDKTKVQYFVSHYEPLKQAVEQGFGKTSVQVQYGTPNYEFLKQLQTNTAVFTVFKSHASMQDMAAQLKDANGNLRSKEDFRTQALKIDADYRGYKLDVEYDAAVRQARSAEQWQKALSTKKLYPNIEYLPSVAAHPRVSHMAYYGIILPMDNPFWDAHLPITDWGCKCRYGVTDKPATDIPDKLPDVNPVFSFNPGKTGQVFDINNSDYIKSVPPDQQPALIKTATTFVNNDFAANTDYQTVYASKNGGKVEAHPLTFKDSDYKVNLVTARSLANEGNTVRMLPNVQDEQLRKTLLPQKGIKGNSSPDFYINNDFVADSKNVKASGKRSVAHAIDEAREQSDNVIIMIDDTNKLTQDEVIEQIKKKAAFKEMKDFKNIWVNYKGKWIYNPQKTSANRS